jgi:hypothetical protein
MDSEQVTTKTTSYMTKKLLLLERKCDPRNVAYLVDPAQDSLYRKENLRYILCLRVNVVGKVDVSRTPCTVHVACTGLTFLGHPVLNTFPIQHCC